MFAVRLLIRLVYAVETPVRYYRRLVYRVSLYSRAQNEGKLTWRWYDIFIREDSFINPLPLLFLVHFSPSLFQLSHLCLRQRSSLAIFWDRLPVTYFLTIQVRNYIFLLYELQVASRTGDWRFVSAIKMFPMEFAWSELAIILQGEKD